MAGSSILCFCLSFVMVHPVLSTALPAGSRMGWEPQDLSKTFDEAFNGTSSFNILRNWRTCMTGPVFHIGHSKEVEDYSAAIQSNLNTAGNAGGGSVVLEAGVYFIHTAIEVPSHTCIIGAGIDKSIIKLRANTTAFENKGILYSRKGERISLQGFTIDGNKDNQITDAAHVHDGVYSQHINYLWIRNVCARNMHRFGFDLHGSKDDFSSYLLIEGSIAINNRYDGFKLHQTYYGSVVSSLSEANGQHGISVDGGSKNILIQRSAVISNGDEAMGCGIRLHSSSQNKTNSVQIRNTSMIDSKFAGVCASNVENITVERCKINNSVDSEASCYDAIGTSNFSVVDTECNTISNSTATSKTDQVVLAMVSGASGKPDVNCALGVSHNDVCCPRSCGTCGGNGCGDRHSDGACCVSEIRATKRSCATSLPPCIIPK